MLDEASHAVRDMKSTLAFPVIYSFVGLGYLTFWIFVLLYIYSVQNEKESAVPSTLTTIYAETTTFKYYEFDGAMQDALAWHFVTLFYMVCHDLTLLWHAMILLLNVAVFSEMFKNCTFSNMSSSVFVLLWISIRFDRFK